MIEIRLYGNLRHYSNEATPSSGVLVKLDPFPGETMHSLLERLEIPVQEINHVFFNSNLLATRTRHAQLFSLPQYQSEVDAWNLAVPVGDNSRIGLFGLDIPMLSM